MVDILLHPATESAVQAFWQRPTHAVLITAPEGSGKRTLAEYTIAGILNMPKEELLQYPYLTIIEPENGKQISIEAIRDLQHVLTLKVPTVTRDASLQRFVVIDKAHLLTTEAQNALLKTLEEPPLDTVLILTASNPESLLPTIRSRVREIHLTAPGTDIVKNHLMEQFPDQDISQAVMISGGLIGLAHALLQEQTTHTLYEATVQARELLQATAYQRLARLDTLSKQKDLALNVCFILGHMAHLALQRPTTPSNSARWQRILKAAYEAEIRLRRNVQPKLALMNLLLEL